MYILLSHTGKPMWDMAVCWRKQHSLSPDPRYIPLPELSNIISSSGKTVSPLFLQRGLISLVCCVLCRNHLSLLCAIFQVCCGCHCAVALSVGQRAHLGGFRCHRGCAGGLVLGWCRCYQFSFSLGDCCGSFSVMWGLQDTFLWCGVMPGASLRMLR